MRPQRIALVTGANQGIGFALVQGLAERLDVTDATAVANLAADLQTQYGGVDLVISNAIGPLTPDRTQAEQADEFIAVANGGTTAVLRSFAPVLRKAGRLIVVASSLGTLDNLDAKVQPAFEDGHTLDQLEQTVEDWRQSIHAGTASEQGWPDWINTPSKVAQVAAVRAVAATRRTEDLANGTLIASVCPGLVDTRASRPWFDDFSQARTPEEAVQPILDLILTDHVDPTTYGELIRDGKVLPWLGDSTN
jgi:NAD(P)-dependent dehydrogenase (short-subunit alcohol dehydrogenase family)